MNTETAPYAEIGKRLRVVRTTLSDQSQKEWATANGFNVTQYNNWERGNRRIPIEAAIKLCERYGLSLDAIFRGRLDAVPDHLRKVL